MATVMDSPDYKLARIILAQKKPFTLSEISYKLQQEAIPMDERELKKTLIKFRDNRIIVQNELNDSFYLKK